MKKIFITGGSGHLGQKLVNHILPYYEVLSPTSEECNILDLNNLTTTIENFNPDIVIHLAGLKSVGESIENSLHYYNNNLISTLNLLKIMKKFNCKNFVFSSSATVYGKNILQYTYFAYMTVYTYMHVLYVYVCICLYFLNPITEILTYTCIYAYTYIYEYT
jgi:UDP-glucose 4-epimerase